MGFFIRKKQFYKIYNILKDFNNWKIWLYTNLWRKYRISKIYKIKWAAIYRLFTQKTIFYYNFSIWMFKLLLYRKIYFIYLVHIKLRKNWTDNRYIYKCNIKFFLIINEIWTSDASMTIFILNLCFHLKH